MVTCILRTFSNILTVLLPAVLLLLLQAAGAWAATTELAPGLRVTLPESLAVNAIESQAQDGAVILVGNIEEQESYFMAAVKVRTWERNHVLWRQLESAISKRSDSGGFRTGFRGSFTTALGDSVWHTLYEYESDGQPFRQVYYLLKSESAAYWVTLTVVEGVEVKLVTPLARALIRRAQLE